MKYIYGLLVAVAIYFMAIGNNDITQFSLVGVISAALSFVAYLLLSSSVEKKRNEDKELSRSIYSDVIRTISESSDRMMDGISQYAEQIIAKIGDLRVRIDEVESNADKRHQDEVNVINEKMNALSKSLNQIMASLNSINSNQQKSFDTVRNEIIELSNKEMEAVKEFKNSISSEQTKLVHGLDQLVCEKSSECVSLMQGTNAILGNGFSEQVRINGDLSNLISEKSESHVALIDQLRELVQELSNAQQIKVDELDKAISERDVAYVELLSDSKVILEDMASLSKDHFDELKSTIDNSSLDRKTQIKDASSSISEALSKQNESILRINKSIEEKANAVTSNIENQKDLLSGALTSTIQHQFESEQTRLYESITNIEQATRPLQDSVKSIDVEISNIKETVQLHKDQFVGLLNSNIERVNQQVESIQKIDGDICAATEKAVRLAFADESEKLSSGIESLQTTYLKVEDQTAELFEKHNELIDRMNGSFEDYRSETNNKMEDIDNGIDKLSKLVKKVPQDVEDVMFDAQMSILDEFEKHQSAVIENKKSQSELNKVSERLEQVTKRLKR